MSWKPREIKVLDSITCRNHRTGQSDYSGLMRAVLVKENDGSDRLNGTKN